MSEVRATLSDVMRAVCQPWLRARMVDHVRGERAWLGPLAIDAMPCINRDSLGCDSWLLDRVLIGGCDRVFSGFAQRLIRLRFRFVDDVLTDFTAPL